MHRRLDQWLQRWPLSQIVLAQARGEFLRNRQRNLFFGVHASWPAALAAAQTFGLSGYDNPASAAIYDTRLRIDAHDYAALYWLTRSLHEGLRGVLDIGGAVGIKFMAFRNALASFPELTWCVHDVPAMVEHGQALAAARGEGANLRFAATLEQAQAADILYASGVVQYLPQSLDGLIERLQHRPRRIIINTAPMHATQAYFTVNSIGTAYCAYRVQTQAELVRQLARLGYKLRESWVNPDKPLVIPGRPDLSLDHYMGFCFDLQPASGRA